MYLIYGCEIYISDHFSKLLCIKNIISFWLKFTKSMLMRRVLTHGSTDDYSN